MLLLINLILKEKRKFSSNYIAALSLLIIPCAGGDVTITDSADDSHRKENGICKVFGRTDEMINVNM